MNGQAVESVAALIEWDLAVLIAVAVYAAAALCAVYAIHSSRTPQSAMAWSIALIAIPFVTIPLYLVFGRNRFYGYVRAHRSAIARASPQVRAILENLAGHAAPAPAPLAPLFETVRRLTGLPFSTGNTAEVLIDAEATYDRMIAAIEAAEDYVLLQSYIVRADTAGLRFRDALVARAAAGVRVHFLFDEIGSVRLPNGYLRTLRQAGIHVTGFKTARRLGTRWQINFRNHRKVLVVDGRTAFLGGLNIGDEYLGRNRRLGAWRDTHLRLTGPSVQMVQLAFAEDWFWAEQELPQLRWDAAPNPQGGATATVVRTGPADENPACELLHVEAFAAANRRLWIAVGYFVPDEPVMLALQRAALRGVDVRVLIPRKSDSRLAWIASFNYLPALMQAGVKVFHYTEGTMHQKVMLIDDRLAGVGSCNLDNRSLHINFEITALVADLAFAGDIERMLEADFARATQLRPSDLEDKSGWFWLLARAVNLAAPIL
ncbi:MAG: cardiolipin synthase [Alphaproteobacteria bacterium]